MQRGDKSFRIGSFVSEGAWCIVYWMVLQSLPAVVLRMFVGTRCALETALHIQFYYVDGLVLWCLRRRTIAEHEIQLALQAFKGPAGLFLVSQLADTLVGISKSGGNILECNFEYGAV